MNQVVARPQTDIAESVIAKGDLGKLTPEERTRYYVTVCESVGLNPLTQPLAYITLNGKLTLYALKGATDQLRKIYKIAVTDMTEVERDGVIIVTVKVADADGRTDMAKGAVAINGLKGDALANAIMKAETKAKRRATLSICGLGMLDESEVETIEPRVAQRSSNRLKQEGGDQVFQSICDQVKGAETVPDLQAIHKQFAMTIASWPDGWRETFETEIYDARLAELQDAAKHKPRPRALSDDESASVRAVLMAALDLCKSTADVSTWRNDEKNAAAFKSMTKADQKVVADERDARLADFFEREHVNTETGEVEE